LNSEQGLADFAHFLTTMNADMPSRKTIVIGGSYPGALSAWFRDKYPNIATASWAASAVVQPLEDMWSYDE
jgi:predicted alpha/beta-fold hydrolase